MKPSKLKARLKKLKNRQDELAELMLDTQREDLTVLASERNLNSIKIELYKQQLTGKWTPVHNGPIFRIQTPN